MVNINLKQTYFFIQNSAETEKIFLWTALCHQYYSQSKMILCIILSDIAFLLLFESSIAYFWFNISLNCIFTSICQIFIQFSLAALLQIVSLIIWNKVLMQYKFNLTVINTILYNIQQNENLFNDISVMFSDDFTQTLSVINYNV